MKTLAPHQSRVVIEKAELDEKIAKLGVFVVSEKFSAVDEREQTRLTAQLGAMAAYAYILGERIAAF